MPPDSAKVNTLYDLAWKYMFSNPKEARVFATASLSLAKSIKYQTGIGNGYNIVGISYDLESHYDSSLHYFIEFLHFNRSQNYTKGIARATNNLSIVYQNLQEYEVSLNYARQSFELELQIGDSLGAAQSLTNMANQYIRLDKLDSAQVFFDLSQSYYFDLNETELTAYNHEGLGEIALKTHQYGLAISHLEKALRQWIAEDNKYHEAQAYLFIGKAYLNQGKMTKAYEKLLMAEELATPLNSAPILMEVFEQLSDWYEKNGKFPEALRYLQLHTKYQGLVFDEEKARQLASIEAQYGLVEKDAEIASLSQSSSQQQSEIRLQRQIQNTLFISVVVLLSLLTIVIRYSWRTKQTNKMLEVKREEVKKKNLEIVHQKYKALRASKAKSRFLAMMSHEIRTPMNAVIGITNLLLQEDPRKDQEESLNTMKFAAENLLVLINDILDYNKIEAGKIEFENIPFNLQMLLQSLRNSIKGKAAEKQLDLIFALDPQLPHLVKGDPTRLAQILTNLLSNAVKFTERGKVELKMDLEKATETQYHLVISITDTGIGISKDNLNSIFESFQQATSDITRRYGGTGLGLSITKKLIELQGSQIQVESEQGRGTRFFFTLTFEKTSQTASALPTSRSPQFRDLKGVQVLIAEDNQVNELVARRFLNKWGVEVDAVPDGLQAVTRVQEKSYDLVLMDLQMPIMDGFKATRKIRNLSHADLRALPIIALTASAMNEIRHKAFEAGVTDFIAKPFNPEELRAVLEKYVLRSDSELVEEI